MTRGGHALEVTTAEECLRRALEAKAPANKARWARRGLATDEADLEPDTHVLLLRQLYLAHVEADSLDEAALLASQMADVKSSLRDIALHDAARVLAGLGRLDEAIAAQRLAARRAPAERRSFHLWSLATLEHFSGEVDPALRTLARAERWARGDRAMLKAHAAYVRLAVGRAVPGLAEIVLALQKSPAREGYGQYLLGMIAWELGDRRRGAAHLRAFVRRHASADRAKTLTLREELRRARKALAAFESV